MKILLISDDHKPYDRIRRILKSSDQMECKLFNCLDEILGKEYDIVLVCIDKERIKKSNYAILLALKCNVTAPVLALMEESTVAEKFEVLSMGAEDYIEISAEDSELYSKLSDMMMWKWYYDRKERKQIREKAF